MKKEVKVSKNASKKEVKVQKKKEVSKKGVKVPKNASKEKSEWVVFSHIEEGHLYMENGKVVEFNIDDVSKIWKFFYDRHLDEKGYDVLVLRDN